MQESTRKLDSVTATILPIKYITAAGARVWSMLESDNSNGQQNLKWFGGELKYGEGGARERKEKVAWWAAVYGVAQSRTRLKRLSSSSSRDIFI